MPSQPLRGLQTYCIAKDQQSNSNLNTGFFYQACYCTVANLTMVLPKTLPIWKSPGEKSVHQMSVLQAKEMLHLTKLIRKR